MSPLRQVLDTLDHTLTQADDTSLDFLTCNEVMSPAVKKDESSAFALRFAHTNVWSDAACEILDNGVEVAKVIEDINSRLPKIQMSSQKAKIADKLGCDAASMPHIPSKNVLAIDKAKDDEILLAIPDFGDRVGVFVASNMPIGMHGIWCDTCEEAYTDRQGFQVWLDELWASCGETRRYTSSSAPGHVENTVTDHVNDEIAGARKRKRTR